MTRDSSIIENSVIPESANVGQLVTILNTQLSDSCMIGSFSKMAYSEIVYL